MPVTAEPSCCPFPCRGVVPGRSVIQALKAVPEGAGSVSEVPEPKLFYSEAL